MRETVVDKNKRLIIYIPKFMKREHPCQICTLKREPIAQPAIVKKLHWFIHAAF